MSGKNKEGYSDPTATEALCRIMQEEKQRLKDMCNSCMHRWYCGAAYKKDTWCGNHTERGGKFI
ncbi:hypothetical protein EDD76_102251 [Kineothrix alysoides]|uniref:Uncharacterized protein n=1 Tax=Kineothrix alysoides TaxID=1469948 RepID=A0A4R1R4Y4_9FIRM|nr:hypothetical protein [Kineothrix alysoides]TCL60553.1 hypothetical protein EDD76_102251 [Kineothrix alysoides]